MPQHDCFLEKGTCDPKDFGGKGLELRLMLTRTARVVDSIWLLAVVSHKRTWTVRIPDISDEGFLSRRIFFTSARYARYLARAISSAKE